MSVMKIAGKTSNNTVQGVAVSTSGNVMTQKIWQNEVVQIYSDANPPTTDTHRCTAVDLSDAGGVSIRVENTSDVDIVLGLYTDYRSGHYSMRDATGQLFQFTVGAGKKYVVITPDDWPVLQWIAKLSLCFTNATAATSGAVAIYAVVKR